MDKKGYRYLLSLGHIASDINQGALPAVLPFLIASYHYDYTTAATLVMVANIVGSLIQPILGQIADKHNKPWIMIAGIFLAGAGMAALGFMPGFAGMCAAVMVSGVGIAMFHPQAAQLVNRVSEAHNRGQNISIFSMGGCIGSTLGPIVASAAIAGFGMKGTLVFLLPPLLVCTILAIISPELKALGSPAAVGPKAAAAARPDQWGAFAVLCAVIFARSVVVYGLNTFLALYCVDTLGQTEAVGNTALSYFFVLTTLGTLVGGKIADRYGHQKLIRIGCLLAPALIFAMTLTDSLTLAMVILFPVGIALNIIYSPMVVLGQLYLPNHMGLASGMTLGLAVSIGGIAAPLLGKFADLHGVIAAIYICAGVALIPLVASLFLPRVNTVEKEVA